MCSVFLTGCVCSRMSLHQFQFLCLLDYLHFKLLPSEWVSFYKTIDSIVHKEVTCQKDLINCISFHLFQRNERAEGQRVKEVKCTEEISEDFRSLEELIFKWGEVPTNFWNHLSLFWIVCWVALLIAGTTCEGVDRTSKWRKVCLFLQALVLGFVSLRRCRTEHLQAHRGVERYKQALKMVRCQLRQ